MKIFQLPSPKSLRWFLLGMVFFSAADVLAQGKDAPVTVSDSGASFVLTNGYLTATISKTTGDMTSLKVNGLETQGYVSGHHAGYWEQNPNGAARI